MASFLLGVSAEATGGRAPPSIHRGPSAAGGGPAGNRKSERLPANQAAAKQWFDPDAEPYGGDERRAHQGLVWQCRFSGIEVPDALWRHAATGAGRLHADDMAARDADATARFDAWVDASVAHVAAKGPVPGTTEAERAARSAT